MLVLSLLAMGLEKFLYWTRASKYEAGAKKLAGPGGNIAEIMGWSPFRVNANLRVLRNFTEAQLRETLGKLLEIDRKIKSTTLPPKFLLGQLI
ncbi:MAG: hypothetical protein M1275_03660 [Patescibacteria group bacterium]|nr:hypothetical protein [Patescibacteria group bacterium]